MKSIALVLLLIVALCIWTLVIWANLFSEELHHTEGECE